MKYTPSCCTTVRYDPTREAGHMHTLNACSRQTFSTRKFLMMPLVLIANVYVPGDDSLSRRRNDPSSTSVRSQPSDGKSTKAGNIDHMGNTVLWYESHGCIAPCWSILDSRAVRDACPANHASL